MNSAHNLMAALRPGTVTDKPQNVHRVKYPLMAALAVAMLAIGSADLYAQSRVFYDNFEANNTDQWGFEYSKCTTVTTGADGRGPRYGNYMARCNWNGLVDWTSSENRSSLLYRNWNYSNEFFLRFWVRHDQNVDNKGGSKLLRLAGNYPQHSMVLVSQMEAADKQLFAIWEAVGDGIRGPLTYGGGAIGDRLWHKVEVYHKDNTIKQSNGVLRVWNDGVLKLNYTGKTRADNGQRWNELHLMSNWSNNPGWEHDATNNVYWDDIEIYSDQGAGATGSMANATISASPLTLPAAPTALRLIK